MTFPLHLLRTHRDLSEDSRSLLNDAVEMLERISTTVRRVLVESSEVASPESAALRAETEPKLG
jgi:hypothetical protein